MISFSSFLELFLCDNCEDIIKSLNSLQWANGNEVLKFYSMDDTRLWMDCVILVAWSIFFEILCLIVMILKFGKKTHN